MLGVAKAYDGPVTNERESLIGEELGWWEVKSESRVLSIT